MRAPPASASVCTISLRCWCANDRLCPLGLIRTEQELRLNTLSKRADIVVHDDHGKPLALVECKAPGVRVDQSTFDQATRYNIIFKVRWLLLTNGLKHYCFAVDHASGEVTSTRGIPTWSEMMGAVAPAIGPQDPDGELMP